MSYNSKSSNNLNRFKPKKDCTPEELAIQEQKWKNSHISRRLKSEKRKEIDRLINEVGMEGMLEDAFTESLANNPEFLKKANERMMKIVTEGNDRESISAFNMLTQSQGMQKAKKVESVIEERKSKEEIVEVLKKASGLKVVGGQDIEEI